MNRGWGGEEYIDFRRNGEQETRPSSLGTCSITFLVARTRLCGKTRRVVRGVDVLLKQIFDDDDDDLSLFPVTKDSGFRFVGVIFF